MASHRDPENIYIGVRPGKKGKLVPFGHRRDRDNPSPKLQDAQGRFREAVAQAARRKLSVEDRPRFIREYMSGFRSSKPAKPGRFRVPRVWEEDLKKAGAREGLKVDVEPQSDGSVVLEVGPMVELVIEESPRRPAPTEAADVVLVIEPPQEERENSEEGEDG